MNDVVKAIGFVILSSWILINGFSAWWIAIAFIIAILM